MQPIRVSQAGDSRLRFVFDDSVVSCRLAANAVFEDVALALGGLGQQHNGTPIAIDVTLACAPAPVGLRRIQTVRHGCVPKRERKHHPRADVAVGSVFGEALQGG